MPRDSEEFEQAWAQIVADLTTQDGLGEQLDSVPDNAETSEPGSAPTDGEPESPSRPEVAAPSERPDLDEWMEGWADEGHFTPPPPPEVPAGTPATRLGWVGVLGGPAVLLGSALTGWPLPPIVLWGAGLATLAGFVTLVWQLPESREDGWDDGAVL